MARKRKTTRKRPISPEDMLRFVGVSSPRISPDGSRVVLVRKHVGEKNNYVTNLWMANTDDDIQFQFTSSGKDGAPTWSPCGNKIAFLSGREQQRQIWMIHAGGGEATKLSAFPEGAMWALQWSPDGRWLGVMFREQDPDWTEAAKKERKEKGLTDPPRVIDDPWYRLDGDGYFNAQRFALYLVDTKTGKHRKAWGKDTLGFFSYTFSPDGKQIAIATNTERKAMFYPERTRITILTIASGKTRDVPGLPEGPKASLAWSPDGKRIAYAGRADTDGAYSTRNLELWVCDPKKGKPRCLSGKEDFCMMAITLTDTAEVAFGPNLQWAPNSRRIFVKIGWHGSSHVASIKPTGGRFTFHTSGAADHDVGNISADGKRFALTRSTADRLSEVFVGDLSGDKITTRQLTRFNADLYKELKLSKLKAQWVKSADGTKVHTWVMMPPDHKAGSRKKYPTILEIHGGPHAQYGVGFFHEFQVLAGEGYMIVFSNPRGSKGYGQDHCNAIRGNWGVNDWTDIEGVIAFMQEHKNVDTNRMGVMGGSYGGYMTNWAIGHTRVFKGAVTDRCVSNIVTQGGTSDWIGLPDKYFPGNFWDRTCERWEMSPLKHIGNARTPTLIIHSEGDLRCNVAQSEQLFAALKLLNVPTRFVRYPQSTSHGMSRGGPPDVRIHRLHQILGWWTKYLRKKKRK